MLKINEIKSAITRQLKKADDIDVFYTNVSKTDSAEDEIKISRYYHVSLIPISTSLFGKTMRDRVFLIDVSYVNDDANTNDLMAWGEQMDSLFLPYIQIKDRSITIEESSFKIVEQVGHYTFTLKFRDVIDYTEDGVPAKDIEINFN